MSKADTAELAAETLSGDLRDVMLTHIRAMETPWSKLSEQQQSLKILAITNATETIVRRAVAIIAARDNEPVFARIAKFTVKDEIKAELVASSSVANIEKVAENIGQPAIVIFANPDAFMGERGEAKADPDQSAIPFDGEDAPDTAGDLPETDPADAPEAEAAE